jgi:Ala-tRNA(Pro) deacylase
MTETAYERLIGFLDSHDVDYRLIDHEPEGRTEVVSQMRGNDLAAAAKCMVVMVKVSKKERAHVLAIVPGDRRIDLDAVKALKNGRYAGIADADTAQALSGCPVGTILPFSWNDDLELVIDPALYDYGELYFNAGRLDRSVVMASVDHRRIAKAHETPVSRPA